MSIGIVGSMPGLRIGGLVEHERRPRIVRLGVGDLARQLDDLVLVGERVLIALHLRGQEA